MQLYRKSRLNKALAVCLMCFLSCILQAQETKQLHYRMNSEETEIIFSSSYNGRPSATFNIDLMMLKTDEILLKGGRVYQAEKAIGIYSKRKLSLDNGQVYKFKNVFFSDRKTKVVNLNSRDKILRYTKVSHGNFSSTLNVTTNDIKFSNDTMKVIKAWGLLKESEWLLNEHNTYSAITQATVTVLTVFLGIILFN